MSSIVRCVLAAGLAVSALTATAQQAETAFTYQGILKDGGNNLDGTADLQFRLFDDEVGGVAREEVTMFGVPVENGLFTVEIDFGDDILITPNAWLEIGVRNVMTGGGFTTLGQRQKLASSLYSVQQRGLRSNASGSSSIADPATGEGIQFERAEGGAFLRAVNENGTTSALLSEAAAGGFFQLFDRNTGLLGAELRSGNRFGQGGGRLDLYPGDGSSSTVYMIADFDGLDANGSSDAFVGLESNNGTVGATIVMENASGSSGLDLKGGAADGGRVSLFNENGGERVRLWQNNDNGDILGYANDFTNIFRLTEDPSAGPAAGSLLLAGGQGIATISVDGDFGGTGEPLLFVNGSIRDFSVNMSSPGSSSVAMPVSAVDSAEILDESGIAAAAVSGIALTPGSGESNIALRTINCPDDGFVLVIATAELSRNHVTGTTSRAEFGVSNVSNSTPGASQDVEWVVSSALPSGSFELPGTVHGVFPVSAGSNTFYFVGSNTNGTNQVTVNDISLTCVFVPTAYGVVSAAGERVPGVDGQDLVTRGPLGNEEILAEQLEAQQQEINRLQREMREYQLLREEMAEIRKAVDAISPPVTTIDPIRQRD